MTLSVIIPAYNRPTELIDCINSLGATDECDCQLIVQDDASPDFDLRKFAPFCERNAVNLGFAGNCNAGAKRALGDVLCFVNQDIHAIPERSQGWATALVAAFDDPQVGIVGARLLFPNGAIQSAGGLIDPRGTPFHRCLGYSNPDYVEVNEAREVTWVTGAVLGIRRELFERLGGFDTIYRSYFEDVDICLRARALGFKVWYQPSCTLVHTVGSTGGSPHFANSAMTFRKRWVDTGKFKPDTNHLAPVQFW